MNTFIKWVFFIWILIKVGRVLRSMWRKFNRWVDRKQSERERRLVLEWEKKIRAEGDAPWLRSVS